MGIGDEAGSPLGVRATGRSWAQVFGAAGER